jgi:hypothetical protein
MPRFHVTPELAARMTQMRHDGMTIEQVALEIGTSMETVKRHTPKGIDHHTRGRKGNQARGQMLRGLR